MATAKLASGATSGAPPEPKWRHSGRSASWAAARNGSQWSLWNDGRPRRCGASVKVMALAPLAAVRCTSATAARSEEHTSELQSLMRISYAVFCLKQTKTQTNTNEQNEI